MEFETVDGDLLDQPVDVASLAVFRVLFGLLMAAGLTRFLLSGWVEELFIRPSFFFKYSGFEWVQVWGPTGLYIHFGVLIVAAIGIALGLCDRLSLAVFAIGFTWIQLMDQTNYLNHYYLVILVAAVLIFVPANSMMQVQWIRVDASGTAIVLAESAPFLVANQCS